MAQELLRTLPEMAAVNIDLTSDPEDLVSEDEVERPAKSPRTTHSPSSETIAAAQYVELASGSGGPLTNPTTTEEVLDSTLNQLLEDMGDVFQQHHQDQHHVAEHQHGQDPAVSAGPASLGDLHLGQPVSYTHLTLPTICSV